MSLESEFKSLYNKRRWFDLSNLIIKNKASHHDLCLFYAKESIEKMHPVTLKDTLTNLLENSKNNENLNALVISSLKLLTEKKYSQEKISIEISDSIYRVSNNIIDQIEYKFYDWLSIKLSEENYTKLSLLGYFYYEKVKNYDLCLYYYLKYKKNCKNDFIDFNNVVKYSILSPNFYNFSKLTYLKEYSSLNKDLKGFFDKLKNGNLDIDFNLLKSISNDSQELDLLKNIVQEKLYIIKIINLCLESLEKKINFDVFLKVLKIEENYLLTLFLKLLGINLIKGWVDTEERAFYYNSIVAKSLTEEEIKQMKTKFKELRRRIVYTNEIIHNI